MFAHQQDFYYKIELNVKLMKKGEFKTHSGDWICYEF